MRIFFHALLVISLAACGDAPQSGPEGSTAAAAEPRMGNDAATSAAAFRAAAQRLEKKAQNDAPTLQALATPLPDGILPDFEYSRLADLSSQTAHSIRQVALQVRGLAPEEALTSLQKAFVNKGWTATDPVEAGGGNRSQSFFKGGKGGAMSTVVAAGGTHITVMTSRYDPSRNSAFTGALNIVINAP